MLGVFRQDTNQGTDSQDAERRENRENMLGGKRDTEEDTYQMKEISTSRIPDFDFF